MALDIDRHTLVRDILLNVAGAIAAFEKHHVDYCCGGSLPLVEACGREGVSVDAVLATLEEEASKPGAEAPRDREMLSVPLADLVKHIVTDHHDKNRRDAVALVEQAQSLAASEGAANPALAPIAAGLAELYRDLLPHLAFEERHVFPYIEKMERAGKDGTTPPAALYASISEPIAAMIREHEAADHVLHAIRAHTRDYQPPEGASDAVRALYQALADNERELVRHMHLEGNVLLPRAERLEVKLRASMGGGRRRH